MSLTVAEDVSTITKLISQRLIAVLRLWMSSIRTCDKLLTIISVKNYRFITVPLNHAPGHLFTPDRYPPDNHPPDNLPHIESGAIVR